MDESHLPSAPGTYVLILRLDQAVALCVGRLGVFPLTPGLYAYVGSARGPGGLRARLRRHLRANKAPHWHIDSLTALGPVISIWLDTSPERLECAWARKLAALSGAGIPIPGFGSSDCACVSHLFVLPAHSLPAAKAALGNPTCLAPSNELETNNQ
jgi:Uri superfamily endonuclease